MKKKEHAFLMHELTFSFEIAMSMYKVAYISKEMGTKLSVLRSQIQFLTYLMSNVIDIRVSHVAANGCL